MPTPAPAFAAVAAVIADIDPADTGAVQRFYGDGLASYPPAARSLIADFLIGLSDLPSAGELQALKVTIAKPASQLPALDVPRRPRKPANTRPRRPASHGRHKIDVDIGARLRQRRISLGMSEQQLAVALGLTVRKVEQYERGDAGLAAATLHTISRVLDVPVGFFFPSSPAPRQFGFAEDVQQFDHGGPASVDDDHADLLRAYDAIPDAAGRRRALALLSFIRHQKA